MGTDISQHDAMKSGKTFLNTEIHSGEWKSLYISYCIYCINTVEG